MDTDLALESAPLLRRNDYMRKASSPATDRSLGLSIRGERVRVSSCGSRESGAVWTVRCPQRFLNIHSITYTFFRCDELAFRSRQIEERVVPDEAADDSMARSKRYEADRASPKCRCERSSVSRDLVRRATEPSETPGECGRGCRSLIRSRRECR